MKKIAAYGFMHGQLFWLEFLYQALHSEYGICLAVSDLERARQKLYATRRELQDESLSILSIIPSPTNESQLWVPKRFCHEIASTRDCYRP